MKAASQLEACPKALRGCKVFGSRASVGECAGPPALWRSALIANRQTNGFSPKRGYGRVSHGSRKDAARAKEPWLLGLAGGNVFQSGGGPPHANDAGAFTKRR